MDLKEITAILIDDDREAVMLLELLLKSFPEVKIVGKANKGIDGLELIKKKQPNIVFLDIDMPDINGIKVAETMKEKNFKTKVVFTTAFHTYAYDAIHTQPLDYLVKPFGTADLNAVIRKYRKKVEGEPEEQIGLVVNSKRTGTKLKLPTFKGVIIVRANEIVLVKADGIYCEICLSNGTKETVYWKINRLFDVLKSQQNVYRINRQAFINLQYLRRVDRKNKKCILCFHGEEIEEIISRQNINFLEKIRSIPIS